MSATRKPWYRELHWQIAVGIVVGFIYAMGVRLALPMPPLDAPAREATMAAWESWAAPARFLGDLFIRALKLIIIPLVVASLVTGVRSIGDTAQLGRVGLRTLLYYMVTTFVAVVTGLVAVNLIRPGVGLNMSYDAAETPPIKPLLEVFRDIIPPNALAAFAANDMLPSIAVAMLLGAGLLSVGAKGDPLAALFESLNEVVLKITGWIMATSPVGVAALFAATLLDPKLADVSLFLTNLGGYMATVLAGLGFHGLVILPLTLWIFTRRNPFKFIQALAPALLTSFSTASSAATYPVTLDCVTERAGVPRQSASFVLPLGATINMDGTALYEAVAAVFIANALGIELSMGQQLIIVITATLAAIGAAGVPSAGLVTMIVVLESVGLPGEAYGLVVAVDRLLDMVRTTVNVWGDAIGAAVVSRWMPDSTADHTAPALDPP